MPSCTVVLGGAVIYFITPYGRFPIDLAVGDTETGKLTAILSLFEMAKDGRGYALSCILYGIDET